ncbi:MAG: thioesterase family protein [Pseudomonadota bacterium]
MARDPGPALSFETAFLTVRQPDAENIDANGHVNNVVYLEWAQEIAIAHWLACADSALVETCRFVVRQHLIDYRAPIFETDTVEVRTWLGKLGGARMNRHTDIRVAGASAPSASAVTQWCLVDATGQRPKRIEASILNAFGL